MAGLTADGFIAKTLEDIQAGFVTQQRATIDAQLDTSQFSLIGQLNGIMASEIAQVWELAEELHDAIDPDKATGAAQDALYSLTNTLRRAASKSLVLATVSLEAGANIAIGDAQASVEGNPSARFTNAAPMVNLGAETASFVVLFEALEPGPTLANALTLTVRDTGQSEWLSVTNLLDAELGTLTEQDGSYRLRRLQELAAPGGGTAAGIAADLRKLLTARAALVLENSTDDEVDGLPPHSIEAVVYSVPGALDEAEIAASLWGNKPAGIQTVGSEAAVAVLDSEGYSHAVYFSRPAARPVYVALRLLTATGYPGDVAAKTAIVAAAEDPAAVGYLDVGSDVYAGQLVAAAMALPGVLNADARLSFSVIADFASAPVSLVLTAREIAALDTSRISIGVFP